MDQITPEPMRLITDFLAQTRADLKAERIHASDAILAAVRLARMYFLESMLAPLTRELLGYSADEAILAQNCISACDQRTGVDLLQYAPAHRMIKGYAIPVLAMLHQASSSLRPTVIVENRFCSLSATEIEILLAKSLTAKAPYVVLDFEEEMNLAFVCKSEDLALLHANLSIFAAQIIDCLITELEDPGTVSDTDIFIPQGQSAG